MTTEVIPRNIPKIYIKDKTEPDNGYNKKPMHNEFNRINSFNDDWPLTFLQPSNLAKAGFYYTKKEDIVRCAFCNVEVGRWAEGDDVNADHRRWSSQCPFVKGLECGNIPMSETPNGNDLAASNEGQDMCGKYNIHLRPNSHAENEELPSGSLNYQKLGVQPSRGPAYASYAMLEKRVQSYGEWPISIKQTPAELAEAGFYYTGKGDQTVCFYCGGGLKDWEGSDDPWEQHARWFSKCSYVVLKKGSDYIAKVCSKANNEPLLSCEQAQALTVPSSSSLVKSVTSSRKQEVRPADRTPPAAATKDAEEATSKATLCKICYTKEVGVVFLPCGHMVACIDCAPALSKCAVCRCDLEATVRAFLS